MDQELLDFIVSVLSDDCGISEESYRRLIDISLVRKDDRLTQILWRVDATDSRYYLPGD